MKIMLAAL